MKSEKILHFIYGQVGYENFLVPLLKHNKDTFFSQEVVFCEDEFPITDGLIKRKTLHFGFNFKLSNLRVNLVKLFKLLSKQSPSIVVAHMSLCATYPLICSKILKVPHRVYFCHGAPYLGYNGILRLVLIIVEKINISMSTLTICVSPSIEKELKKISKTPHIHSILPGSCAGLASEKYLSRSGVLEKINTHKNELKLLYVGRPHKRKGIYDLLDAVSRTDILEKGILIDIVGFESNELNIQVERLPPNVKFHGFQTDVGTFYHKCDIIILPSWHEGFGYALLEGAAYGCAMVASNIPGPDAIVVDNFNGRLITPRCPADIERCILDYYHNRIILNEHMKNAYKRSFDFSNSVILQQVTGFLVNSIYRK